jgi:formate dehydrogenase iron-sulfur subunit
MSTAQGILIDTTLCTGCEMCIDACKKAKETIDGLSASRWSTIIRLPGSHFVRNQCRHCLDPACVSACIVGALKKLPQGQVVYDRQRCMGCRYCMLACPYGIPRYDWDRNSPRIEKCKMCDERVRQGRLPACVEACPEKAMIYGARDDLLVEAHRRIDANPTKYIRHVWGEKEFGGTSIMYVSDIPLDFLMWKPGTDGERLPELTWAALHKVPGIVMGMGALMTGIYWIIGRRMKLSAIEAGGVPSAVEEEGSGVRSAGAEEAGGVPSAGEDGASGVASDAKEEADSAASAVDEEAGGGAVKPQDDNDGENHV